MNNSGHSRLVRVLGVDPAAAGPTRYGVVETEGRNCRVLHYGALRVGGKRKESVGAALEAADALAVALCHLQADQSRRRFGAGAVRTANVPASRASVTRPASATPIQLPRISTLR